MRADGNKEEIRIIKGMMVGLQRTRALLPFADPRIINVFSDISLMRTIHNASIAVVSNMYRMRVLSRSAVECLFYGYWMKTCGDRLTDVKFDYWIDTPTSDNK